MENNYIIRLATEGDCSELSRLKHEVWDTTYRGIYPDEKIDNFDYDKNKNTFIKIVNNPEIELYVVECNGKIVGYMDYGTPHRPFGAYKMVNGCLDGNPSNDFYKHMGGKLIKKIPFIVKNYGQELVENVYYYDEI